MSQTPPSVAFEGIDGSGKGLQFGRLRQCLESKGLRVGLLDFPCYEGFFGKEIGRFLAGGGDVSAREVDVRSMSLWYAMDRWQAYQSFDASLYDIVLLNRSTMANAAYQSARLADEGERRELIKWLFELEFQVLSIPSPDTYFIFDIPVELSRENVARKGHRSYVGDDADVYERDMDFLRAVREGYRICADVFTGAVIMDCSDGDGHMRPPEDIEHDIYKTVVNKYFGGKL